MTSIGTVARGAGQAARVANTAHTAYNVGKSALGGPGESQQQVSNAGYGQGGYSQGLSDAEGLY